MKQVVGLVLIIFILGVFTPALAAPLSQEGAPIQDRVSAITEGAPAWEEDFETALSEKVWWDDATDNSDRFFDEGAYQIAVYEPKIVAWGLAEDLAYEEFLVRVDTSAVAGSTDNQIGIVFRYLDDDNFYVFRISSDGFYSLTRLVDGEWESLIPWTTTDAILQVEGWWNEMELLVEDGAIHLLVNGEYLDSFEDEESYEGGLGLLAGVYEEADVQIAFDDFAVWDLQDSVADLLEEIWVSEPLRHDDFRSAGNTWRRYRDAESAHFVQRGRLHIQVTEPQTVGYAGPQDAETLSDFLLEIEAAHVAGPLESEIGIVFRRVGEDFYYFKISSDGYYALDKYVDGEWEALVDWTPSDVLNTGEESSNLLGVLARGPELTLLANDFVLTAVEDDALSEGRYALAAGTAEESGVEAAFDELYVWEVAEATPMPAPTSSPAATTIVRTATPAATAAVTPAIAVTPQPVPTLAPSADRLLGEIRAARPAFSDEFRRSDSGWATSDTEDSSIAYADRALIFNSNKAKWLSWSRNERIKELDPVNYLLEVDAQHLAGPTNVGFGVLFAFKDANNYYRFFIAQNGYYSLQKIVNGVGTDLAPWTQTAAINTTAQGVNRLGLLVQGDAITILANEQVLAQVKDAALTTGDLGVIVATDELTGLEVAFDNVDLWLIGPAATATGTPPTEVRP